MGKRLRHPDTTYYLLSNSTAFHSNSDIGSEDGIILYSSKIKTVLSTVDVGGNLHEPYYSSHRVLIIQKVVYIIFYAKQKKPNHAVNPVCVQLPIWGHAHPILGLCRQYMSKYLYKDNIYYSYSLIVCL